MSKSEAKNNPSNNDKKAPTPKVKPENDANVPLNYIVSKKGTTTLIEAIHDVVSSPHVRQVLFNVINDTFIPVKDVAIKKAEDSSS